MEEKRWEFVDGDELVVEPGHTVRRIRALVPIEALGVEPGDLGGYVESESNLPHTARSWVAGEAMVYGDAQVLGDALVKDEARVFGCAQVSGEAEVSQGAWVCGVARVTDHSWVFGDAIVSGHASVTCDAHVSGGAVVRGNARVHGDGLIFWATKVGDDNGTLTVYASEDGLSVSLGEFEGSVDAFLTHSAERHDIITHGECLMLLDVGRSRILRARSGNWGHAANDAGPVELSTPTKSIG